MARYAPLFFLFGAQVANAASAVHMTWYGEGNCSTYQTSADHAIGECFNYAGGSTSERFYDCDSTTHSIHYDQPDCQGTGTPRSYETGACLSWNSQSWMQFACTDGVSKQKTSNALHADSQSVLGTKATNAARSVHMTYYRDTGCSTYENSFDFAIGECFNYSDSASERFYDCDSKTHSIHYDQPACQGTGTIRSSSTGACLSWNSQEWVQFACTNDLKKQNKGVSLESSPGARNSFVVRDEATKGHQNDVVV